MLLLARRSRKAVMVKAQASLLQKRGGAMAELAIPAQFRCPISLDLMRDLVMATMGITYDREGIEAWLDTGRAVCPVTHAPLWLEDLVPNHAIRHVIQDWCVANRSHGVERIPTPKIPATPIQASEMLFNVAESARGAARRARRRGGRQGPGAREGQRAEPAVLRVRRHGARAGRGVRVSRRRRGGGRSRDVLAALVCMMPLDEEAARVLASSSSMGSLVAIAKHGSLPGRLNAVLAIKEAVSRDGAFVDLADDKVDKVVDALVVIIKAPICPQATKAAMVATYHLASSDAPTSASRRG
uniref:U-box domain-containing protein n=1 Tax=Oryza barthii TaxID=65489 RepID=A0A0D3HTM3_9ORYZ